MRDHTPRDSAIRRGFHESKQVDFSLSKRFPVGMARVEFRAEIFNLFNNTNSGNRTATLATSQRA